MLPKQPDRVVLRDGPPVLEAEHALPVDPCIRLPPDALRILCLARKAPVVVLDRSSKQLVRLLQGAGVC